MGPTRVLLVDDELSSTEVLALVLAEEGYHVTMAGDGRQALARLEDAAPDLLVTDFMMPGMNGAELIKAVQAIPRYANLPVVVMSGAPESALRRYKLDYRHFLRKPFGLDEFLEVLAKVRPGRA